jgi:hypothetical protein
MSKSGSALALEAVIDVNNMNLVTGIAQDTSGDMFFSGVMTMALEEYSSFEAGDPIFTTASLARWSPGHAAVTAAPVTGQGYSLALSMNMVNKVYPGLWIPPETPEAEPFGSHVDKNRYISMVLPTEGSGELTAIGVRLDSLHHPESPLDPPDFSAWEGAYRWVNSLNETHTCPDSPNFPDSTFRCAVLGCQPEYRNWTGELNGDTLHVTGASVVPSSRYSATHIRESACVDYEEVCLALGDQLSITTVGFGDVDPLSDGLVVLDVARIVDHVKGKPYPTVWPPESGTGLFKPRVHLRPNVPDALGENVGVLDIATGVDAVKGNPYWLFGEFGPCTDACAGEAPCP